MPDRLVELRPLYIEIGYCRFEGHIDFLISMLMMIYRAQAVKKWLREERYTASVSYHRMRALANDDFECISYMHDSSRRGH